MVLIVWKVRFTSFAGVFCLLTMRSVEVDPDVHCKISQDAIDSISILVKYRRNVEKFDTNTNI